jgi:redox-sensitive bicupin YhaK (pirin superfamily)
VRQELDMNDSAVQALIVPPIRDLGGGFKVRRALPAVEHRMVGPYVFLDQMGPTVLAAGRGWIWAAPACSSRGGC